MKLQSRWACCLPYNLSRYNFEKMAKNGDQFLDKKSWIFMGSACLNINLVVYLRQHIVHSSASAHVWSKSIWANPIIIFSCQLWKCTVRKRFAALMKRFNHLAPVYYIKLICTYVIMNSQYSHPTGASIEQVILSC